MKVFPEVHLRENHLPSHCNTLPLGRYRTLPSSSSDSYPLVLTNRHPNAIKMLEEVFHLSVRDYDVLTLCGEAPLSPMQCNVSRLQSAKSLEERGFLLYSFPRQRWDLTVLGLHAIAAISYYISLYEPVKKGKAAVLEFPSLEKRSSYS